MTIDVLPGCEPFSHRAGSSGVLILHGFTGNPTSMRSLAERMTLEGFSVELPRLRGHGTNVEDLMTTTWSDWCADADTAYRELASRCPRVAVVGLSMGGGLCAYVAEHHPSLAGCVFINPLVKPAPDELRAGIDQLLEAGVESVDSIGSDIKKAGSVENAYAATPLAAARSLFEGIENVFENLHLIVAPSLLMSSREDHVVSSDNGDDLALKVSGPLERVWLENSYHVATMDNDQEFVESLCVDFLTRVFSS